MWYVRLRRISFVTFDLIDTVFCLQFVRRWSLSTHATLIFSEYVALAFADVEQVFDQICDFLVDLVGLSCKWEAKSQQAYMLFKEDLLAFGVVGYPVWDNPDEQFFQFEVVGIGHDRGQDWEQILLLEKF